MWLWETTNLGPSGEANVSIFLVNMGAAVAAGSHMFCAADPFRDSKGFCSLRGGLFSLLRAKSEACGCTSIFHDRVFWRSVFWAPFFGWLETTLIAQNITKRLQSMPFEKQVLGLTFKF